MKFRIGVLMACAALIWSVPASAPGAVAGEVIIANDGTVGSHVIVLPAGGIVGTVPCGGDLTNGPGARHFVRAERPEGDARRHQIVAYDEDCGSRTTLFSDENFDIEETVRWSRDGTRLAFTATRYFPFTAFVLERGIFVGDVVREGSTPSGLSGPPRLGVSLQPLENPFFSWAPDNRQVAFHLGQADQQSDIFVASLDTGNKVNITNSASESELDPDFSPSGDLIAFSKRIRTGSGSVRFDIFTMRSTGGLPTQVTTKSNTKSFTNIHPSWSPNGRSLAFSAIVNVKGVDVRHIHRIASDGSGKAIDLTQTTDHHIARPLWRA